MRIFIDSTDRADGDAVFPAAATMDAFATDINRALATEVNEKVDQEILKRYTWKNFSQRILDELCS